MVRVRAIQIAPSILACDMSRFGEEIHAAEKAGADLIHLDVMDGHFVPNITIGFPVIEKLRRHTQLPFDAHLMIDDADRYLEEFSRVGCNWISVHVEACRHINRTLNRIRELGMKAGVAINPGTSLCVAEAALADADYVLVMSVNPGFGGQRYLPNTADRIRQLKKMMSNRPIPIQVDGGIKEDTIGDVVSAGAQICVVGTGIFSTPDYRVTIQNLRNMAVAGGVSA